jgi:preprotein translocase subunit SecD
VRINKWLALGVLFVALVAIFIDGYSYIYRYFNHIPFNATLQASQTPTLFGRQLFVSKGLDLQGGTEVVLEIDPRSLPTGVTMPQAQASTVQVMENRVNNIGVREAVVQTQGSNRVVVQLPGVDFDRARALVGKTSKLTFRVWTPATPVNGKLVVPNDATGDPVVDPAYVPVSEGGTCFGSATKECIPLGFLPKEFGLDGSQITVASESTDQNTSAPVVSISLTDNGSNILGQQSTPMAAQTQGTPANQLAIFLDNTMVNNANVISPLTGGSFQISGGNVGSDATYRKDLVATLNAGKLPGKISIVAANSVGATLGSDSVRLSLLGGGLGLAVVVLFMIGYYRLPGVVASVALLFYAAVVLAAFKLIPVTLTLAGIAGFVLSVGMAVDANVLIFERLREELRNGRSLAAAVEAAHTRALPAIRDSNISTLITCAVLYLQDRIPGLVGFTQAKGFGLTLGIGVAVSFFSAVVVTNLLLHLVIRYRSLRTPFLFAVERMQ